MKLVCARKTHHRSLLEKLIFNLLFIHLFFLLTSCLPTSDEAPQDKGMGGKDANSSAQSSFGSNYPEPKYPLNQTFVQEGETTSSSHFALPYNFGDTFLLRGKTLSTQLRTLSSTVNLCLVLKFDQSPSEKFLVLSATRKFFIDFSSKTSEYYLQVSPSDKKKNETQCPSSLLDKVEKSTTSTLSFDLVSLCPNCQTSMTSSIMRLLSKEGNEIFGLSLGSLNMTVGVSNQTTAPSQNSCFESSSCQAKGFSCCLNGICVKDGALKPGASTMPGFQTAQSDVAQNPDRFKIYPDFYFICGVHPETTPPSTPPVSDPDYEARVRLMEMEQLHQCVNKVDDEFSYCSVKFDNVTTLPQTFSAGTKGFNEDINFSSLNSNLGLAGRENNIVKVFYGGRVLYEKDKTPWALGKFIPNTHNDDLTQTQQVELYRTALSGRKDNNLYLTYKVDGTCESVSSTSVRCTKTYVQDSTDQSKTTWHDNSKLFKLPPYADLGASGRFIVKVNGVVVPESNVTWIRNSTQNGISFVTNYPLYKNQTIEITYFVKSNSLSVIALKEEAQKKINSLCRCHSSFPCTLSPVWDKNKTSIVNYSCTQPNTNTTSPPINQTVYVSSKNAPHRYFDLNGVLYDEITPSTPPQELKRFFYEQDDLLRPNNLLDYVGFNEIYGNFDNTGKYRSRPAKMVPVKLGMIYDIVVSEGAFSGCQSCGTDYYGQLQKIFPQNFRSFGGGYTPNYLESSRLRNKGLYRSDDLLFGRACFIPATMIPWTHKSGTSAKDQRQNRLNAQHLLFANGYNRDWYGFDYGSLIGSFDGVSWFSIGSQRRIRATGTKLYLAINSYFGDLIADNKFTVNISETTLFSSDIPDHDLETDGAECQRAHYCSTDDDCYRLLGYDYSCQNVSSIRTNWPRFTNDGTEIIGENYRAIASLVGGVNSQANRCVYRGRGAPCLENLNQAQITDTNFNKSNVIGNLMCSVNNSCTPLVKTTFFNHKIARFGVSPEEQNNSYAGGALSDLLGLGARVIGRPFNYYGNETLPSNLYSNLASHYVLAICTPGKNLPLPTGQNKTWDLHFSPNSSSRNDSSDKIFGVGRTDAGRSLSSLNTCPATTTSGRSVHLQNQDLGTPVINARSISQNLSSNLLNLSPLIDAGIFSSQNGSQVTSVGYQKNTCLRAPGASCFSDLECAPSEKMAEVVNNSDLTGLLSEEEIQYWKEDLICGNPEFKYNLPGVENPSFDIKNNKCCRDIGKILTVYTQKESLLTPTFQWCFTPTGLSTPEVLVAGVNSEISNKMRYSRVHSVYDQMTCDINNITPTKKFALSLVANDPQSRYQQILGQYETLDKLNERSCCSGHWVRSFAQENGGGHAFSKAKMQEIDKTMFKHISWAGYDSNDSYVPFNCTKANLLTPACKIKKFIEGSDEEMTYLRWSAGLELIGIPQVALKTNDEVFQQVDDNQKDNFHLLLPLKDNTGNFILKSYQNYYFADFKSSTNSTVKTLYSATNYSGINLENNSLKKVFSEHEFNCCIPTGKPIPISSTSGQCCTGFSRAINSNQRLCCLPDYTDVTVYLNRYVSSEGRGLASSEYDESTGYIKNPDSVERFVENNQICCSGKIARGVAISELPIPLEGGSFDLSIDNASSRRFTYLNGQIDDNPETGNVGSKFEAGVRWNHHIYCVPQNYR